MGVDLKLLPILGRDYWVAHDAFSLERRRELWPMIEALPHVELTGKLSCYFDNKDDGEPCYGDITDDRYGNRLTWVTVASLLALKDSEPVQDNWQNRAVWAYLAHMPPDWQIVLYWC